MSYKDWINYGLLSGATLSPNKGFSTLTADARKYSFRNNSVNCVVEQWTYDYRDTDPMCDCVRPMRCEQDYYHVSICNKSGRFNIRFEITGRKNADYVFDAIKNFDMEQIICWLANRGFYLYDGYDDTDPNYAGWRYINGLLGYGRQPLDREFDDTEYEYWFKELQGET